MTIDVFSEDIVQWVILGPPDPEDPNTALAWSNEDGWVSLHGNPTLFSREEIYSLNMPDGARMAVCSA